MLVGTKNVKITVAVDWNVCEYWGDVDEVQQIGLVVEIMEWIAGVKTIVSDIVLKRVAWNYVDYLS